MSVMSVMKTFYNSMWISLSKHEVLAGNNIGDNSVWHYFLQNNPARYTGPTYALFY